MMSAPVRRIDEILTHPLSAGDFMGREISPADDGFWLYYGEDKLNIAFLERLQEMKYYRLNQQKYRNPKEQEIPGRSSSSSSSSSSLAEYDDGVIKSIECSEGFREQRFLETGIQKLWTLMWSTFMEEIYSFMKPPNTEHADRDDDVMQIFPLSCILMSLKMIVILQKL